MIIVTLVGYQVAGISGAAVATVAMCGPTCVLAFLVARTWDRFTKLLLIGILAVALPVFLYYGIGWRQLGYRYSLDFLPQQGDFFLTVGHLALS